MNKIATYCRPFVYFVFLLTFACIPLSVVESGSLCMYYNFLGVKCAGCGVTRGFTSFMHFDFARAYDYNSVFTCAVFPVCIFLILEDTAVIILRAFNKTKRKSLIESVFDVFDALFLKK